MKVECRFCKIVWGLPAEEKNRMLMLAMIQENDCYIRPRGMKHEVRGIL
jgi:hypothetical protein